MKRIALAAALSFALVLPACAEAQRLAQEWRPKTTGIADMRGDNAVYCFDWFLTSYYVFSSRVPGCMRGDRQITRDEYVAGLARTEQESRPTVAPAAPAVEPPPSPAPVPAPVQAGPLEDGRAAYDRGDYATALRLLRPLAEQGNASAQFNLGDIYLAGHGVPQDFAEAVKWYRMAGEQGHARAQFNLGDIYFAGQGVLQDYVQAHLWYNLLAARGNDGARISRESVAKKMTPAQIAEAQRLAQGWRPKTAGIAQSLSAPAPADRPTESAARTPKQIAPTVAPPRSPAPTIAIAPTPAPVPAPVPKPAAAPRFPETPIALTYSKVPPRPDDIAVIIGNADYRKQGKDIPDVVPAYADAEGFKRYAMEALGVREGNVIHIKDATQAQLISVFGSETNHKGQLFNWVQPEVSNVFVFYAGHGAPSGADGQSYLVPADANASTIVLNGYPVQTLYRNLGKVPAKSITLVLESCFSGLSQAGAVVGQASPVYLQAKAPEVPPNVTVISAGAANQIASWEQDSSHGLFTKYFLKGMSGEADQRPHGNGDGRVAWEELGAYLKATLTYYARRYYGRDQTAQIVVGKGG